MTAAGFDQQVGYATESTFGTFVSPTRHLEHVKSGLKSERRDFMSKGVKAGRRTGFRYLKGPEVVAGPISHELSPANIGLLLVQGMGAVSTSGSNPYTHVITPGALVETRGTSVQVGTPSYDGTVRPFNFAGCQVTGGSITVKAGAQEAAMIDLNWVGQHFQNAGDGDTPTSLASTSYDSNWLPFTGFNAVLTLNGSEYEFDELTFTFDNGLRVGNYTARSTTPHRAKPAKEEAHRTYGLRVTSDFWDLTSLNRAYTPTEVSYSLALTSGTSSLTIAGAMKTMPETPTIDGTKVTKETLNLVPVSSSSDAATCTMTLVNANSTP